MSGFMQYGVKTADYSAYGGAAREPSTRRLNSLIVRLQKTCVSANTPAEALYNDLR